MVSQSTDLAKKTARISDFEDIFYGLADFERSADHGFLQYFSVDFEGRIVELKDVRAKFFYY